MKCVICKTGETKLGTASVTFEEDGSTLVVKEVPARICQNCGEEYMDEEVTEKLLSLAERLEKENIECEIRQFQKTPASRL